VSKDYKILFLNEVNEEISNSLGDYISTQKEDNVEYLFEHGGESENLCFSEVDWINIDKAPFAYIDQPILKSEVAQLILRRAAGNVGGLNIDDLKDDLIEKSFTIKVLNDYTIGHIADIVLNFASEREVPYGVVRPYVINLLSFLSLSAKSEIISYPFDLDCGFSKDTFFIQAHCPNNSFLLNNLLDSVKNEEVGSHKGLFLDILKYCDLLDVFTLKSTQKLVMTSCWFFENVWESKKNFSSLIVHDMPMIKLDRLDYDNSVNSFLKHSVDSIAKLKAKEELLPKKYDPNTNEKYEEVVNPIKVKNIYNFFKDKVSLPVNPDFSEEDLDRLLEEIPNSIKKNSFNKKEKREVINLLKNNDKYAALYKDVQIVKNKINSEDYASQMIDNISKLTVNGANSMLHSSRKRLKSDITRIRGTKEDLGGGVTRVKGQHEESNSDNYIVTGITTEVINDNSPMLVRGSKESSGNVDNDLMSLSSFNSFDEGDEDWEFKRSKVVEEMKLQLNEMQGLSKNEIDEKVQTIFENQLGISTGESEHFLEDFSDSVTEEIIEKGVDLINTEIREKIRLNKVEGQLENREKQVEKMNLLITKLKIENGNLNAKVRDLEKENKTLDFNHRKAEEQIEVLAQSIGDDEPLAHAVENKDAEIFKMKNENEKLHSQIESLKKRVNFMYENSKANAATNIDANDVQAMSEENIRLKNLMGNHNNDIDKMKIEKRELENLLEKKKNELREKDILLAKYIDEENGAQSRTKELEIKKLKDDLQRVNKENKETVLKAKSFEQKLKFVNAQLDRYKSEEKKKARGASAASANDTKMNSKINKLESEQGRLKEAAKKAQKELAEKKTELHKVNLENKTLNVKLRELEKKLEILGRKAS